MNRLAALTCAFVLAASSPARGQGDAAMPDPPAEVLARERAERDRLLQSLKVQLYAKIAGPVVDYDPSAKDAPSFDWLPQDVLAAVGHVTPGRRAVVLGLAHLARGEDGFALWLLDHVPPAKALTEPIERQAALLVHGFALWRRGWNALSLAPFLEARAIELKAADWHYGLVSGLDETKQAEVIDFTLSRLNDLAALGAALGYGGLGMAEPADRLARTVQLTEGDADDRYVQVLQGYLLERSGKAGEARARYERALKGFGDAGTAEAALADVLSAHVNRLVTKEQGGLGLFADVTFNGRVAWALFRRAGELLEQGVSRDAPIETLKALPGRIAELAGGVEPVKTATATGKPLARLVAEAKGVENLACVHPGLYRGGQPTEEGYDTLKALGIKTVVSLRSWHDDRKRVEARGMSLVRIGLDAGLLGSEPPQEKQIVEFFQVVRDPARQPVFVHCREGKDRTGTMLALYRMEADGWTNDEAIEEMQAFGYHDLFEDLIAFVRKYERKGLGQGGK